MLWGGWIAKMGAAVVFGLMAAFYLRYVETAEGVRVTPRLADVFDTLTYRQRYEALLDKAGRDSLTGLLDRGRFDSEGRSLVNDAMLGNRSLSLMVDRHRPTSRPSTTATAMRPATMCSARSRR